MTTKKELQMDLWREEADTKEWRMQFWVCLGAFILISFLFVYTSRVSFPLLNSKILPQEVCVNQTEQVYECANWICPEGYKLINLVVIEKDKVIFNRSACVNATVTEAFVTNKYEDYTSEKITIIQGNYGRYYLYPNIEKLSVCQDNLYELKTQITQNCTSQKEVCSEDKCTITYRK